MSTARSYPCSGRLVQYLDDIILAPDPAAAADAFRAQHGIDPDTVDGVQVLGRCEGCGQVVLEGEPHILDAEDRHFCQRCRPQPSQPRPGTTGGTTVLDCGCTVTEGYRCPVHSGP